ncbi:hypothetical protein GCM10009636_09430 [Arthrobacter koreensis]|jgi:hypothetical protein|uniref:Uncharacterized protein n=1 Tax=Arthrobacter koreensis TaxID=199136 RepID=A0ABY6FR13_9MICC|nr:hypothetical protein [Arthrobacter koreensis]UYB35409.1 hypothetical protein N9A08_12325 [Arthrobacter koreensis]
MELLIFLIVAAAVVGGLAWGRRHFSSEIDRAKRIRRANRDQR